MLSRPALNNFDDRWRLRNCTPLPTDSGLVSRGNSALKGSRSNSSTKLSVSLSNTRTHTLPHQISSKCFPRRSFLGSLELHFPYFRIVVSCDTIKAHGSIFKPSYPDSISCLKFFWENGQSSLLKVLPSKRQSSCVKIYEENLVNNSVSPTQVHHIKQRSHSLEPCTYPFDWRPSLNWRYSDGVSDDTVSSSTLTCKYSQ